jgi:UDP-glucose 4-epimerase
MLLTIERASDKVNVYNLGTDEYCEVDDSIGWITAHLGVTPERSYTGGERGWIGDSPFIFLDTARIRALGWKPKLSIREGVIKTVDYLRANPWLFDERA